MTDDIVTRLRVETAQKIDVVSRLDMKCLCCPCCEEFCLYCETVGQLAEAADEIERLRAEVARLTLVSSLWESEFVAAVDEIKRLGKS